MCSCFRRINMNEEQEVTLEGGKPWGIRLQGGMGTALPLQIATVTPGSKASNNNVQNGSSIEQINVIDARRLTMAEAEDIIRRSGDTLRFRLKPVPSISQRGGSGGGGGFYEDIMNPSYGGEGNWRSREAKGNTFNMMKEHVEAGQGSRVLSQFDVAHSQRNRAIATTAPKVHRTTSESDGGDVFEAASAKDRCDSNPPETLLVVMQGGKPWGMRLKGGKSCGTPLAVASVNPGSKAYNGGLLVDDQIRSINDRPADELTVAEAQEIVKDTGDELRMSITREALRKRLMSAEDEEFFEDLKMSMSGGDNNRRGRDVKGNAFKLLQQVVGTQ